MRGSALLMLALAMLSYGQNCHAKQKDASPPRFAGGAFFTTDDNYPAEALKSGQQGGAKVAAQIDATGKPTGCRVIESSGSSSLDEASCAMLSKLRFKPARDENGKAVEGEFVTKINWTLPRR